MTTSPHEERTDRQDTGEAVAGASRPPCRRDAVIMSRRFDDVGLAAQIAAALQVVADPREPSGYRILERPDTRVHVPLMGDLTDRLQKISEARGTGIDVLVDEAVTEWLRHQG
jgi:hypothetical protein